MHIHYTWHMPTSMWQRVNLYICLYLHIQTHTSSYLFFNMYACMYVCTYVCMYVGMSKNTCMYTAVQVSSICFLWHKSICFRSEPLHVIEAQIGHMKISPVPQVSEYVKERVDALRQQHPGRYVNITAIRTNAMKYLPNYFRKGQVGGMATRFPHSSRWGWGGWEWLIFVLVVTGGQLEKMFFLFPDPHFKEKNHRRRIITSALLAEYAYVMAVGGDVTSPLLAQTWRVSTCSRDYVCLCFYISMWCLTIQISHAMPCRSVAYAFVA